MAWCWPSGNKQDISATVVTYNRSPWTWARAQRPKCAEQTTWGRCEPGKPKGGSGHPTSTPRETGGLHPPVCAGGRPDSKQFESLTNDLARRYQTLAQHCQDITLVFDKGNNSEENLRRVEKGPFHFVGSLPIHDPPWL